HNFPTNLRRAIKIKEKVNARLLQGKGVNYIGADVQIDGNIVTGNGPQAAEKFAQALVALLRGCK
ncbi:hypothetical protein HY792_05885, partial [Candidatus Desantisbacteria bacterium]|nr:hypothetical protein [Candidatus Desantisbacteria bacterium]